MAGGLGNRRREGLRRVCFSFLERQIASSKNPMTQGVGGFVTRITEAQQAHGVWKSLRTSVVVGFLDRLAIDVLHTMFAWIIYADSACTALVGDFVIWHGQSWIWPVDSCSKIMVAPLNRHALVCTRGHISAAILFGATLTAGVTLFAFVHLCLFHNSNHDASFTCVYGGHCSFLFWATSMRGHRSRSI